MARFYHMTPIKNIPLILSQGIRPSIQTGMYNEYFGVRGDPNYAYFWSGEVIKRIGIFAALGINPDITIKNTALLRIDTSQFFERDYDQLLFLLWKNDLKSLNLKAKMLGINLTEFSEDEIKPGHRFNVGRSLEQKAGQFSCKTNQRYAQPG
jgi:hypothetical protein